MSGMQGFRDKSRRRFVGLFLMLLCVIALDAQDTFVQRDLLERYIWETDISEFSATAYDASVEAIVQSFERERGEPITPGETGIVALKVQTAQGGGLATPLNLVSAVADALVKRGFVREDIRIVDLNTSQLREAQFLPSLSQLETAFEGMSVQPLDSEAYYDPVWFYDNPLPPPRPRSFGSVTFEDERGERNITEEERRSYLPTNLFLDVDFWINLPVVSDHRILLLHGALTNASVYAVSNTRRFLNSSTTGPVAVAEIASIPELREKWLFTLLSLERYQYIGGPQFNSLYTRSEPLLWLSTNAVALDALMLERLNDARQQQGFDILRSSHPLLEYAQAVGLGFYDIEQLEWKFVSN